MLLLFVNLIYLVLLCNLILFFYLMNLFILFCSYKEFLLFRNFYRRFGFFIYVMLTILSTIYREIFTYCFNCKFYWRSNCYYWICIYYWGDFIFCTFLSTGIIGLIYLLIGIWGGALFDKSDILALKLFLLYNLTCLWARSYKRLS